MADLTVDGWALTEITLDHANQFVPDILVANANDALGRGIDLRVTMDGVPVSMAGMSAYLVWRHENGNQDLTGFVAVDANAGHFKVYYPAAMMHAGTVLARIAIYIGADTPITGSRDFRILVEQDPIDASDAMSDESFSLFQKAVIDLNEYQTDIEQAEEERKRAEDARRLAESLRVNAEQTRAGSESDRAANELNRISAEQLRAASEDSRATAEQLRNSDYATIRGEAIEATEAANVAASKATDAMASLGAASGVFLTFAEYADGRTLLAIHYPETTEEEQDA